MRTYHRFSSAKVATRGAAFAGGHRFVAISLSLLTIASQSASAISSATPSFSYAVPYGCPDRAEFLDEVLARSQPSARDAARTLLERVSVGVKMDGSAARGHVLLPSGETREVVGSSCAEVVQALALVVALQVRGSRDAMNREPAQRPLDTGDSMNREPAQRPLDTGDSANPEPMQSPLEANTPASNRALTNAAPSTISEPSPTTPPPLPVVVARSSPSLSLTLGSTLRLRSVSFSNRALATPEKPTWTVGVGGVFVFGAAPMPLFGAALFGEYLPSLNRSVRIIAGAEVTTRRAGTVQDATGDFQWWAGRAAPCMAALRFSVRSELWLCAEVVSGVTIVQGQRGGPITHPRSIYQGWLSFGPAARLRLGLPANWATELAASVAYPAVQHRAVFENPSLVLHETGSLAGFLLLRLGRETGDPTSRTRP